MKKTDKGELKMVESIALFTTLDSICVMGKMSDDTYRIYQSGTEIGVYDDLDTAAEEMYDFKDRLEKEATDAGLFSRADRERALEEYFGLSRRESSY